MALTMKKVGFLLACLLTSGCGRRLQISDGIFRESPDAWHTRALSTTDAGIASPSNAEAKAGSRSKALLLLLMLAINPALSAGSTAGSGATPVVQPTRPELEFPDGFLWGAATAAYQIEGAHDMDGKGSSIWDDFSHTPGRTWRGQNADVACDHYHQLEGDVQRMKEMGLQAYRFSLSWPRLMPDGTPASENPAGVEFYRRLFALLKEAGIKAVVTLYHWDLPSALQAQGGWLNPEAPEWYEAYARRCFELFDDDVEHWITFNEPWCMCVLGFGSGVHAPGRNTDPGREPYLAAHHVLLSHAKVYRMYKRDFGQRPIGIVLNSEWREPRTADPRDKAAAQREIDFMLGWFAEPIFLTGDYPPSMRERCGDRLPVFTSEEMEMIRFSSDFFGFNWYSARMSAAPRLQSVITALSSLIRMGQGEPGGLLGLLCSQLHAWRKKEGPGNYFEDVGSIVSFRASWRRLTHMTWPVVPWGLARILVYISERYKPDGGIYITENGVAVAGEDNVKSACDIRRGRPGARRISYVRSHLVAIQRAISKGADVRGYYLWSFMDNFEWAFGYKPRFGAYHVNYKTLERTPKPFVGWFKEVIVRNAVQPTLEEAALNHFSDEALDSRVADW